jgi:hypothetical protein
VRCRSPEVRLALLLLLPAAAAVLAVFVLLRAHSAALSAARGTGGDARTPSKRALLLANGDCAVLRRERVLLGRVEPSPAGAGTYTVRRLDVRASVRVDTALVRIVPCPRAARGMLTVDSSTNAP